MNILRVTQRLYPASTGGAAYHVHALSRDQTTQGHDVTVVTTRHDRSLSQREVTDGYEVIRLSPGVSILGNDVSPAVARYLYRVNSSDFDIIHAHSHLYFSTNLASLKRNLDGIPLVITNHGLYSQSAPSSLFRWYLKTIGKWTFDQADIVICYSETDKLRLRDLGVSGRIEIIPNGINTAQFTPEGSRCETVLSDGPVILFVGRLVKGKQPEIVLKVFAEFSKIHSDAKLVMCGDGPLRGVLQDLASRLGVDDSVIFLGTVPYEQMPRIYRSSDVLVLTSKSEGMPRTVLEALSAGVPVVSNHLDQLASIVKHGGETVVNGEIKHYVDSIDRVLNNQAQLGADGREAIVENHRWQNTVSHTTNVMKSIL